MSDREYGAGRATGDRYRAMPGLLQRAGTRDARLISNLAGRAHSRNRGSHPIVKSTRVDPLPRSSSAQVSFAPLVLALLIAQPDTGFPAAPTQDSLRLHRQARRAQSDFEGDRRRRLPFTYGSPSGRCDVRLGRFCYWHDEESPPGPEEPPAIAPLRERLTERLDSAASLLPGDGWIVGQQVRYLVEAGRGPDALRAVERCRAERWWCVALEAFVLHTEGDHAASDSVFGVALAAMPSEQRCEWENISDLLPSRARGVYTRLACEARREWSRPVWWLADPMWTKPGNDRRTEHYARHVRSLLERESRTPYPLPWGDDTHDLVVRYGWPDRWSREQGSTLDPSVIRVIGHEPHPAFDFIPNDSGISAPFHAGAHAFDFRHREARSRYAPPYARAIRPIDAQVTRFFRGDSLLVVAAFDVPDADTMFSLAGSRGALAVSQRAEGEPAVITPLRIATRRAVGLTMTAAESSVVSVEMADTARQGVARARIGLNANPREIGLLLYESPQPGDASLEAIAARSLGSLEVSSRKRLGMYWEADAPAGTDSVTYVLTVFPRSASWLTRLARTMRLTEAAAPVHLRFTEPASGGQRLARSVGVDLSHLPPGNYAVRVRVEAGEATVGEVTRSLKIRR